MANRELIEEDLVPLNFIRFVFLIILKAKTKRQETIVEETGKGNSWKK
jgi:hypothetical protein